MLPKTLDDQIAALENLFSGRRGLQLASFLLFADSYLIVHDHVGLLAVDADWLKVHLGIPGVALLLSLFLLLGGVVLPWIHFLFVFASVVSFDFLLEKAATIAGAHIRGISEHQLLSFALLTNNGVAYQEYLRHASQNRDRAKWSRWAFTFLCFLVLDLFVSFGPPLSLVESIYAELHTLPAPIFYPSLVAIGLSLVILTLGALAFTRFSLKHHDVALPLHVAITAALQHPKEPAADTAESVASGGSSQDMLEEL